MKLTYSIQQDDVDPTITKEPITKEDIPAPDTSSGKDESPISFWQAVLIPVSCLLRSGLLIDEM